MSENRHPGLWEKPTKIDQALQKNIPALGQNHDRENFRDLFRFKTTEFDQGVQMCLLGWVMFRHTPHSCQCLVQNSSALKSVKFKDMLNCPLPLQKRPTAALRTDFASDWTPSSRKTQGEVCTAYSRQTDGGTERLAGGRCGWSLNERAGGRAGAVTPRRH